MSIKNIILKIRYLLFKEYIEPIKWGDPDWEEDWNNPSYVINTDFMFGGNTLSASYISNDCVEVKSNELHLKTIKLKTPEYRSHWSGNFTCYWKSAWVDYRDNNNVKSIYGTWVFNILAPTSDMAPALWFLRPAYSPEELRFKCGVSKIENNTVTLSETPERKPGVNWWLLDIDNVLGRIQSYDETNKIIIIDKNIENVNQTNVLISGDCITPEVDLMEIINKKFKHTIHYGPTYDAYRKYQIGPYMGKPIKNKEYEFAVRILPTKYEFFIDGIKTAEINDALSNQSVYPILGSAVNSKGDLTLDSIPDFIIKRMRYYKI